jgi:hypothetical protein
MFDKKTVYINITPIPQHIPRQLAVDLLHSHGEIITLNPLVTDYVPCKAPNSAPADEYYSTWYNISQRIQYVPGVGKIGSGSIKFNGCFHDMPWGLQTHIYAPAGVDLRNKWRIAGNQPGEPREIAELGLGAPAEGLYLREDVEIRCNMAMTSFVKKETKAASKILVDRLIKKAELLDAGVLRAMMEDGKLKTYNPADRSSGGLPGRSPSSSTGHYSPQMFSPLPQTPTTPSYMYRNSGEQQAQQHFPQQQFPQQQGHYPPQYQHQNQNQSQFQEPKAQVMELPGDFGHAYSAQDQKNAQLHPPPHPSPNASNDRWSGTVSANSNSRPTSYATDSGVSMISPRPEQQSFQSGLIAMAETREEHEPYRGHAAGTFGQEQTLPQYDERGLSHQTSASEKEMYIPDLNMGSPPVSNAQPVSTPPVPARHEKRASITSPDISNAPTYTPGGWTRHESKVEEGSKVLNYSSQSPKKGSPQIGGHISQLPSQQGQQAGGQGQGAYQFNPQQYPNDAYEKEVS